MAIEEVPDHVAAKAVSQVEGQMGEAGGVAGAAGGPHRHRRAAGAVGVRRARIDPEPQGHAHGAQAGFERLQQGDRAVDAAGHGHGDPVAVGVERLLLEGAGERRVQGVGREGDALAVVLAGS